MKYKIICLILIFIVHYLSERDLLILVRDNRYKHNNMSTNKYWDEHYKRYSIDQSFGWGFIVMIIPFTYQINFNHSINFFIWLIGLFVNIGIHYFIDRDNKERYSKIKVSKRIAHIIQVFITWILFILI